MNMKNWEMYFPFAKIRDIQREALDFIIKNKDKRFYIAELPVGTGKSAIAVTLSKWIMNNLETENQKGSYLITTQKILQNQYINDFKSISNIWSKSNYKCQHRKNISCLEGQLLSKIFPDLKESKNCEVNCIYTQESRNFFKKSPIGVTNIAYMLNQVEYNYHGDMPSMQKRQLLVIDECHNLEQSIVDFVASKISKAHCNQDLGIEYPEDGDLLKINEWTEKEYIPACKAKLAQIKKRIEEISSKSSEARSLAKQYSSLDRRMCHTNRFLERFNPENWVITYTKDLFEIKPIYANNFTEHSIFCIGEKVLLMSATILDRDAFCRTVGIPKEDSCFLSLPSPFPIKNREVKIVPAGSMSFKNIERTLPEMNKMVQFLLNNYRGKKGIIHTNSYKVAQYLFSKDKTKRLLLHDSKNRTEIYEKHVFSDRDSVLISPSFTEGIDLINDYSRFQIICKIPFPYLADNYILTKMKRCKKWYEWQTAKTIIQSLGRSVRSEEDYATSYILDSDWEFFYSRNKSMFPEWFREALVFV